MELAGSSYVRLVSFSDAREVESEQVVVGDDGQTALRLCLLVDSVWVGSKLSFG